MIDKINHGTVLTSRELNLLVTDLVDQQHHIALQILEENSERNIHLRIGVYYKKQLWPQLIEDSKLYLKMFPKGENVSEVLWRLGYCLSHTQKRCREAIVYYDLYLQRFTTGVRVANVFIAKGDSLVCIGRAKEAVNVYLQVPQYTVKSHLCQIAYYSAANILQRNSEKQLALSLLHKAQQYEGPYTFKIREKIREMTNE